MRSIFSIEHGMRDHIITGIRIPFTQILFIIYRQYIDRSYTAQKIKFGFFKNA